MDNRGMKLEELRRSMRSRNIDYYIIPTSDFHNSEYVGDYFKVREYYSGFTGSNGTLLVGMDMAGLWTDGRYFVQAAKELSGSEIELFKMGEEGVPTISEYIKEHGRKGVRIGFDGRILRESYVQQMLKTCKTLDPELVYEEDVAGNLWKERPLLSAKPVFVMEEKYCGMTIAEKWETVRAKMSEEEAEFLFVSKLDDIMWFLNIRGDDVECNPVALSFLYISENELHVFLQKEAVSDAVRRYLRENRVFLHDYNEVFSFLEKETDGHYGIADKNETGYRAFKVIKEKGNVLKARNPIEEIKAVKTKKELEHIR